MTTPLDTPATPADNGAPAAAPIAEETPAVGTAVTEPTSTPDATGGDGWTPKVQ